MNTSVASSQLAEHLTTMNNPKESIWLQYEACMWLLFFRMCGSACICRFLWNPNPSDSNAIQEKTDTETHAILWGSAAVPRQLYGRSGLIRRVTSCSCFRISALIQRMWRFAPWLSKPTGVFLSTRKKWCVAIIYSFCVLSFHLCLNWFMWSSDWRSERVFKKNVSLSLS